MNKKNLRYCILTLQYVKHPSVAGYLHVTNIIELYYICENYNINLTIFIDTKRTAIALLNLMLTYL